VFGWVSGVLVDVATLVDADDNEHSIQQFCVDAMRITCVVAAKIMVDVVADEHTVVLAVDPVSSGIEPILPPTNDRPGYSVIQTPIASLHRWPGHENQCGRVQRASRNAFFPWHRP
jgi:hypothetical protein